MPQQISGSDLIAQYDVMLIDAYGVLVYQGGPINGAVEFLERVQSAEKRYVILTNDASRLAETIARRFSDFGLNIDPNHIVTSGSLLDQALRDTGLQHPRCVVIGPEESRRYVEEAGGIVVSPNSESDAEVFICCDEAGFDLLETLDAVVTMLYRRVDSGKPVTLLLPNPDLVYPKSGGTFGITSGSIALVLEAALQLRYPNRSDLRFVPLGKPHRPIFEEARRRAGPGRTVMIGDQLQTDILGAKRFGIDSALAATGITRLQQPNLVLDPEPTYLLTHFGTP